MHGMNAWSAAEGVEQGGLSLCHHPQLTYAMQKGQNTLFEK